MEAHGISCRHGGSSIVPSDSSTCVWRSMGLKLKAFSPCGLTGALQVLDSWACMQGPLPDVWPGSPAPSAQQPSGNARERRELSWSRHDTMAPVKSMVGGPDSQDPICLPRLDRAEAANIQRGQGTPGWHGHQDSIHKGSTQDTAWKIFAHRPGPPGALTSHPVEAVPLSRIFLILEKQHCLLPDEQAQLEAVFAGHGSQGPAWGEGSPCL